MNSPDGFIIPKAMSTQHPDNAFLPSFAADEEVLWVQCERKANKSSIKVGRNNGQITC